MWPSQLPQGACGRVLGVRETSQKGAVWLRLCRRSVAVPETRLKAAFVLPRANVLSSKSHCPFCK